MAKIVTGDSVFSSKTANFTTPAIPIEPYQDITVQFVAAGITSGNGVFSIDGSNDGQNWVTGVAFQDVTQTASTTFVTSKTLSSNSTAAGYLRTGFKLIRIVLAFTTDGSYSAFINGRWASRG
jgi:hypothetical protein